MFVVVSAAAVSVVVVFIAVVVVVVVVVVENTVVARPIEPNICQVSSIRVCDTYSKKSDSGLRVERYSVSNLLN